MYIADGATIRKISAGVMSTVVGSQLHPKPWSPLPCQEVIDAQEVRFERIFKSMPMHIHITNYWKPLILLPNQSY